MRIKEPHGGTRALGVDPLLSGRGLIVPLCILAVLLGHMLAWAQTPPVRVVFSGQTDGGSWDLWLGSAGGTNLKPAAQTPDVDERTPVLSPDLTRVAYTNTRGQLQLYHLYDKAARTLALPTGGRAQWPAWSPDGRSVYYVEVRMGSGPDEGTIWCYDLEAGKAVRVADQPEVEGWPAVSDDGALLFTTWTQRQTCSLSQMAPQAKAPTVFWDKSLTLSGATYLPGGRIAAIGGDQDGQKVLLFRGGTKEREYIVPGASGRPVAYSGGLMLTRIDEGAAGIHVMDLSTGKTQPWVSAPPKGLVQMRDPDYR